MYLNPKHAVDAVLLTQLFFKLHQLLLQPHFTPENVLGRLKAGDVAGRYYGKIIMGGTVKMSARVLSELLAGRTTVQDFYGMKASENPFKRMLDEG